MSQSSGGEKDRLGQIEAQLTTIIENEKTIYDDVKKLKEAVAKIAEVVDQHSAALTQIMGGGATQNAPAQVVQRAPSAQQMDMQNALQIIGPIVDLLRGGRRDPVTEQLVGAALQSAVETLRAGPMLVQAVANSLGGSFGKTYGREAGKAMAQNLSQAVEAMGQAAEEVPQEVRESGHTIKK